MWVRWECEEREDLGWGRNTALNETLQEEKRTQDTMVERLHVERDKAITDTMTQDYHQERGRLKTITVNKTLRRVRPGDAAEARLGWPVRV